MGLTCSKDTNGVTTGCFSASKTCDQMDSCRADSLDPVMYDVMRKSLQMTLLQHPAATATTTTTTTSTDIHKNTTTTTSTSTGNDHRPKAHHVGQYHLLYKHQKQHEPATVTSPSPTHMESANANSSSTNASTHSHHHTNHKHDTYATCASHTIPSPSAFSTQLVVRRRPVHEEGTHGQTHMYAVRYPQPDAAPLQEQAPHTSSTNHNNSNKQQRNNNSNNNKTDPFGVAEPLVVLSNTTTKATTTTTANQKEQDFFQPQSANNKNHTKLKITPPPKTTINEWVTVSEEHSVYVVDVGLSAAQCDRIIQITEQVCRGQYAAYTYAKQTLGCREFPTLAAACAPPVQNVVQAILGVLPPQSTSQQPQNLQLDDREPHLVKYDVTKKERQKLDMHTDKSEWTFLIALSNGCGLDYDGGGTYFECLNATIHIQRGHALVFPGKLRHCGQRITRGLRYLLVGFLVDKAHMVTATGGAAANASTVAAATAAAPDTSSSGNYSS